MMIALIFAGLIAFTVASSHSEALGTAKSPRTDLSDIYLFRSPKDTSRGAEQDQYVTAIFNLNPLEQSQGGPNYSPIDTSFVYSMHFDVDGDNVEDKSFQFLFDQKFHASNPVRGFEIMTPQGVKQPIPLVAFGGLNKEHSALNSQEFYKVRVANGRMNKGDKMDEGEFFSNNADNGNQEFSKAFTFSGRKTLGHADNTAKATEAYEKYAETRNYKNVKIPGCQWPARVFVGPRRDPFSIPLGKTFDLLRLPGASAPSENSLDRFSVTSAVVEFHKGCIGVGNTPGSVIGMYASVRHLEHEGVASAAHVVGDQVSRLGNPLVNELIIGLNEKDAWNKAHPSEEGQFLKFYQNPTLPAIIESVLGAGAPTHSPRTDLVEVLLRGTVVTTEPCSDFNTFQNCGQVLTINRDFRSTRSSTPSYGDFLRLSTSLQGGVPLPRKDQNPNAVFGLDLGGFPNGRRLGDDVVDIALKLMMGGVCLDVDVSGLSQPGATFTTLSAALNYCEPKDVPIGLAALGLADNAPINACDFSNKFPYLNAPVPGDLQTDFSAGNGINFQNGNPMDCVDN